MDSKNIDAIIRKMMEITYVQPGDVPNIELYMDQVTTFMDEYLESSKRHSDDKLLTKTMINNYTKNELLPSPEKKKYSKDHMYTLLFIYYLKNILSISDTKAILKPILDRFYKYDRRGDTEDEVSMEDIYSEIFDIEKEQSSALTKDIIRKYERSLDTFTDVSDGEERELLKAFSFISLLCFDVYVKQQMIGKIIDEHFTPKEEKDKKEK